MTLDPACWLPQYPNIHVRAAEVVVSQNIIVAPYLPVYSEQMWFAFEAFVPLVDITIRPAFVVASETFALTDAFFSNSAISRVGLEDSHILFLAEPSDVHSSLAFVISEAS